MIDRDSTIDRKLQEWFDKESIRELAIRYCHFIRAREIDKVVELYAEDAGFELPPGLQDGLSGEHDGRRAIRASLEAGLPLYQPWPFVHNHLIECLTDTTARGWLHAEVRFGGRDLETGMIVAYEDDYIREKGVWKFKYRKVNATFLGKPRA
jgi:hypothetical protein